jgi:hypothetical protein
LESLILAGAAGLIVALVLALSAPVAVKVPRGRAGVAPATTTAGEVASKAAAAGVRTNSHALASAVAAATTTERRTRARSRCRLAFGDGGSGSRALGFLLRPFGGGGSTRGRELEGRGGTFLLGDLGGLLGIGKGQRVTSLMAASRGAASTTTTASILSALRLRVFKAAKGGS